MSLKSNVIRASIASLQPPVRYRAQQVRRQFHGGVPGLMECIVKASQGIPIPEEEDVNSPRFLFFLLDLEDLETSHRTF